MGNYSKEEIKGFEEKDKRISKLALLKSLIEKLSVEEIYDTKTIFELADKYVDYVYDRVKPAVCSSKAVAEISWEEVAKEINVTIPNETNIKVLNVLMDEYKTKFKVGVNKATLLSHIIKAHGKYPTNLNSISLILEQIKTELGEQK